MGGYMAGFVVPFDILETSRWELRIFGSARRGRDTERRVLTEIAAGRLKPVLDSVVPFEELNSALGRMERREAFGKLVVVA
jgi:alcohol dehydrogenase